VPEVDSTVSSGLKRRSGARPSRMRRTWTWCGYSDSGFAEQGWPPRSSAAWEDYSARLGPRVRC